MSLIDSLWTLESPVSVSTAPLLWDKEEEDGRLVGPYGAEPLAELFCIYQDIERTNGVCISKSVGEVGEGTSGPSRRR